MSETTVETYPFQADVDQVLRLVVSSLYSNKEIFLRELVSNASDAIDRLRFRALEEKDLLPGSVTPSIRLVPDTDTGTLAVEDDGIGMTRAELIENLGTVARSGTQAFLKQLEERKEEAVKLIGQFGVGFYSAYLVADDVEVVSRAAGSNEAWRWRSDAKGKFTVEPAERESAGTTVLLHLTKEQDRFAREWELRGLVRRYSDFVSHPIELRVTRHEKPDGDDGDAEEQEVTRFERVNEASALWQRPKEEVTEEQYHELYKHLTHDFEAPLAYTHFKIEGTQLFTGLLYIPKRPPFDLYQRDHHRGVRLYVKRIFIMDDCEEVVPIWLRFVRGVVDSDDLPLNVSRELLQDSKVTRTIRKQIVKKTLDLLESLAEDQEKYGQFWAALGPVLKEGIHFEPDVTERLAKLVRYQSSKSDGLTSLAAYVERMPEGQPAIYYVTGPSRLAVAKSPHLEALEDRGFEVLFMTDPIDELVTSAMTELEGKPLVSALNADLKLTETTEEKEKREARSEQLGGLRGAIAEVLSEEIREVRVSTRLKGSPACLVVPEGGLSAHLERLLRAQRLGEDMPLQKRILEINAEHPVIERLEKLHEREPTSDRLKDFVQLLYAQALVSEGSPVADPSRFARQLTHLLEQAASAAIAQE